MALKEYKSKRKFKNTPEPKGKVKSGQGEHRFVVQKHHASHLHYDFRLEIEGVLKSWAVPKGPSMNPLDKRLAMMVEDHPIEYGKFEGIIPKGNYGAGTVMVWDEGTYHAPDIEGRKENERILLQGLHDGNLKIVLEGKKLKGEFALVRMNREKGNEWLLIKKKDKYAIDKDILKEDRSVVTRRTLEEIKDQSVKGSSVWYSNKNSKEINPGKEAKKIKMPHDIKPMMATLVKEAFDSDEWIYEIKWDGFRAIAEVNYNEAFLYSRNNLSFVQAWSSGNF
jgi:bifunctional non-homologous end joining protein LigD